MGRRSDGTYTARATPPAPGVRNCPYCSAELRRTEYVGLELLTLVCPSGCYTRQMSLRPGTNYYEAAGAHRGRKPRFGC